MLFKNMPQKVKEMSSLKSGGAGDSSRAEFDLTKIQQASYAKFLRKDLKAKEDYMSLESVLCEFFSGQEYINSIIQAKVALVKAKEEFLLKCMEQNMDADYDSMGNEIKELKESIADLKIQLLSRSLMSVKNSKDQAEIKNKIKSIRSERKKYSFNKNKYKKNADNGKVKNKNLTVLEKEVEDQKEEVQTLIDDKVIEFEYIDYEFKNPKYTIKESQRRDVTYAVRARVKFNILLYETGKEKPGPIIELPSVYLFDLPKITPHGTFVINGAERVIVNQLHKSPGAYYDYFEKQLSRKTGKITRDSTDIGKRLFEGGLTPYRGNRFNLLYGLHNELSMKIFRGPNTKAPKLAVTSIVGALLKEERELYKNEEILRLFYDTKRFKLKGIRINKVIDKILVQTPQVPKELIKSQGKILLEEIDSAISVKPGSPVEKQKGKDELLKGIKKSSFSKEEIKDMKNFVKNIFSNNLIGLTEKNVAVKAINKSTENIYFKLGKCNQMVDESLVKQWRKYNITEVELADPDQWDREQTVNDLTIHLTLKKDPYKTISGARMGIYSRYNAGQPLTKTSVDSFFKGLFDRCFLSEVGRFKLNKKLQFVYDKYLKSGKIQKYLQELPEIKSDQRKLQPEDIIYYIDYIIQLNNGNSDHIMINNASESKRKYRFGESTQSSVVKKSDPGYKSDQMNAYYVDDVDDLENRRVRTVGEQLHKEFERGINRMKKRIMDKKKLLSVDEFIKDTDKKRSELLKLLNPNIINAVINSFFGTGQLSQFMSQTNPLDALTHKRRLSALGPGGLTRKTAKGGVRDVHPTHYGRICPIETPEGSNIGLIYSLALYSNINEMGFIETPYRKIENGKVSKKIEYLDARQEKIYVIAQAIALKGNKLPDRKLIAYKRGEFDYYSPEDIDYMDVSPQQIVSASAALIPFLAHDDANRALMGSNMQRQALPLEVTEPPIVSTGVEEKAAKNSGVMVEAKRGGKVIYADASKIIIDNKYKNRKSGRVKSPEIDVYNLIKYKRGNQKTNFNQIPIVSRSTIVKKGDVIADGPGTANGEMALGRNLKVAFMSWEGYNYEDAVVVSERLVKEGVLTSVHIDEVEIEAREMKMGNEDITRDIPNVSEQKLRDLDENGIIRVGASVEPRDIMVGKVSPKGDQTYTPELRLLKTIFGKKAEEVKDNSLRVPPGIKGKVIRVEVFDRKENLNKAQRNKVVKDINKKYDDKISDIRRMANSKVQKRVYRQKEGDLSKKDYEDEKGRINIIKRVREDKVEEKRVREIKAVEANFGDELPVMVSKKVKVYIAANRKITVGDKIAGRHGNKGIISKILPVEDMPYTKDGEPVDILLNPLSVPSRMNVGQILETHLGWAAKKENIRVVTPVFAGAPESEIKKLLRKNKLPESGTTQLFDGRTGESLGDNITMGYMYIMKLEHMAEDKMHARSTGPYSLITRQPLGGKALFGGQRFGEMEVWAMEGHGAAYLLQEFLTYKSDDVEGRNRVHKAILNGEKIEAPGVPESFKVLVNELQGLGFKIVLENKQDKRS